MNIPVDNLKINPNQNLLGMLASLGFLGVAEYYDLCVLFWFSIIPAFAMVISVCFTTWAYTSNYMHKKRS